MSDTRTLWMLLALGLSGWLLYLLAPVLTPFLIATSLAYVFNPLITRLERWRLPRTLSVVLLFMLLAAALILLGLWLVPRIVQQIAAFATRLPDYLAAVRTHVLPWLQTRFGESEGVDFESLREQAVAHIRQPLTLHLRGSNFQLKVWEALLAIPGRNVTTYECLARRIGQPTASRAIGSAVGHNPIAVLIPCHRVIRKAGDFGNYRYGEVRKNCWRESM